MGTRGYAHAERVFINLPFCVCELQNRRICIYMKGLFKKENVKKLIAQASAGAAAATLFFVQPVMASSGVDSVTQPLTNLKTLVISIIGAVGVIILAKNVFFHEQCDQRYRSRSDHGSYFVCTCFSRDQLIQLHLKESETENRTARHRFFGPQPERNEVKWNV